jgi:dynein heavy chain 2
VFALFIEFVSLNHFFSMQSLNHKPESVSEMGAAAKAWARIADAKADMERLRASVERKNTLLVSAAGKGVDISNLLQRWDALAQRLGTFQSEMEEDKKRLVDRLQNDASDLNKECTQFTSRWTSLRPKVNISTTGVAELITLEVVERSLVELTTWRKEYDELETRTVQMKEQCSQFAVALPTNLFDTLPVADRELRSSEEIWNFYAEFARAIGKAEAELWINYRAHLYDLEDLVNLFTKKLRARGAADGTKDSASTALVEQMSSRLGELRSIFPSLKLVGGECFEKEHWAFLFHRLKMGSDVSLQTLTLGMFIRAAPLMQQHANALRDLAARAQGEITLREAVAELRAWCDSAEFKCNRDRHGVKQVRLISEWRELLSKVSDQQALLASLRDSPYFAPFKDTAAQFEIKLATLGDALQALNQVQRKWLHLEPIFARGALPQEQPRFRRLDAQFVEIMQGVESNPQVCALLDSPVLASDSNALNTMLDQLERCQKALADFLEEKRTRFSRFFFIGDDDMLEILGQAQKASVIQTHLKKLFAGIDRVHLSKDEKQIEAMVSSDGEVVSLRTPVVITAEVESWLKQLADEMQRSLSHLLIACVKDFDLEKYPSQLLCLAECITFTHQCEQAIQSGQLNALYQALGNRLADLTAFETHGNRVLELKVKALVFDVIHNYDVVRQLVAAKVTNLDDWMWHKQLKFRMQNTPAAEQQSGFAAQRCVVLMADAEFAYSYEYLGNTPKLVHTPLTDKCYLVLTQGMHLGYGGNPYGPAGTGKTESVKALGCALGRQVLVFNCDEGIDFQSMGRILTGLVQSGAWGCFDEFNRLKEDQLSAVSQQIQVIQAALKNRDRTCDLLGATIPVNQNAGIFVTMNPAGKEYGGRSRLPDNLKQLFRAVAMSVPDNNLIAEVILYSEGFAHAKTLGHKLVSIFSLSKQLLSPQRHYDWGLRALKTVLGAGGSLIHAERKKLAVNKESAALTVATETHLLVQALNVNTLSKLTYADALRFQALVLDVFPGLQWKDMETANLDAALLSTLEARQLQSVGPQMHKMRQLYEALNQRMGCVIVGPSGCGKSTLLSVLYDALTQKMGQRIVKFVLNPKALDRNRLLGRMDPDTREWFDGVLTAAARGVIREVSADPKVRCWVICDGDIDPEWVEALNSVLDDNRLLTLPNGERIQFNSQVNFIFECHDLQFASPATVSRASMIFLSEEGVDVESLVQAWLDQQASKDEKASRAIALLIQELFYRALAWVKECEPVVPTTLVGTVRTALSHLTDLKVVAHARPAFVLALARGLGSNLQADKRLQLARELVSWAKITAPTALLDCSWDAEIGSLVPYAFIEPVLEYGDLSLLHPPLVQTVDVQRHRDMISTWLRDGEPMLLVGPEGCGKTQLLLHCFSRLKSTAVATVHCSAQTTASHVQAKLLDACGVFTTNLGRVLRPKEGDRLVLYLKDLNLPKPDKYDTSQLISFLQQLITHRGFYNDDLEWLTIERVQIVAQMNGVPSVGRHSLSTRLTSIVRIASINYSDKIQLGAVYTCYLRSILSHAKCSAAQWSDAAQIKRLAACMVDVYEQLQSKFPVDDNTKHLLLTPRELTSWAFGLLRYDLRRHDPLTAVSYELMRLFADRLADSEGRRRVFQMLSAQLQKEFKFVPKLEGVYFSAIAHTLGVGDASAAAVAPSGKTSKKPAITDIDSDGVDADTHPEIGPMLAGCTHDEYHELVERALVAYEREVRVLNVHICAQVLDHAAGVERVLSRPGGSLLLVGDSGVGRRSTAALVAHMLRCRFASPTMSRLYELKHFRNDLKDYIRYAGVEGQPIVLFVEDHHLIQPAFLECVNSLLAAAELPGLFTAQEIDAMLAPLKERFAQNPRGARSLYAFFVDRVRSNLHCVLSFDATNAHMARRIDANPAVSTRCTLMWFGRWAPATVLQLTRARLPAVLNLLEQGGNEALNNVDVDALLRRISYVHDSCVAHGATPRRLVAFLDTIARLFDVKLAAQKQSINHLSAGLGKLKEAEEQVRSLQDEAGKQQVALAAKQRIQEEQMTQITQKIGKAQERRREVDELKKASSAEEAVAQKQKEAVEAELLDVNPILEAARQSVGEIRKDSLAEIKALRMPSPVIQDVITAVFLLLGQEDLSWNTMKSFLSSQSMKEQILHFDARAITPRLRAAVQDHMAKKPDSFDEKKVARVNVSVAPLAVWCVANVKYSIVLEKIAPLTDQLAVVEQSLAGSRAKEAAANAGMFLGTIFHFSLCFF